MVAVEELFKLRPFPKKRVRNFGRISSVACCGDFPRGFDNAPRQWQTSWCMAASPKLSRWFYQYGALNRPLEAPRPTQTAAPHTPPTPARSRRQPRGFPTGRPRKRLTDQQRQAIIDLLKTNPRSPSTVAKEFAAEAHSRPRNHSAG
jgi:hypothetical protein